MNFDDIFAEPIEAVVPPVFSKSHYSVPTPDRFTTTTDSTARQTSSTVHFTSSILLVLGTLAIYWVVSFYLSYKQRAIRISEELAQRRRHGIPDDDKRPFAEAYSAAVSKRRPLKPKRRSAIDTHNIIEPSNQPSYDPYARTLRNHLAQDNIAHPTQRIPMNGPNALSHSDVFPSQHISSSAEPREALLTAGQGQYTAPRMASFPSQTPHVADSTISVTSGLPRPIDSSRRHHTISSIRPSGRKRLYMDPREDPEASPLSSPGAVGLTLPKRARKATWGGPTGGDGNDPPQWADKHTPDPPRKEKRPADTEDDETLEQTRSKAGGKRAKPIPRPNELTSKTAPTTKSSIADPAKRPKQNVAFAVNGKTKSKKLKPSSGTSGITDLSQMTSPVKRGQKRDRDDGDELAHGSAAEDEASPARKRGREHVESAEGTNETDDEPQIITDQAASKTSDDPSFSPDPLCGGRKPGEQWESGNMHFMVGPDGRRLQRGTVKERREKYQMPIDSAHRDTLNTIEVLVDKWYSEEEYLSAKAAGAFAWQHEEQKVPAPLPEPSPSPTRRAFGRSSAGFWDAPEVSPSAQISPSRNGLRESDLNPFVSGRAAFGRLVSGRSSFSSPTRATISTTPQRAPSTKWQKQAMEQEAWKRIQEAKAAEKTASSAPASRISALSPFAPTPKSDSASSTTIAFTVPKPPETADKVKVEEKKSNVPLAPVATPFAPPTLGSALTSTEANSSSTTTTTTVPSLPSKPVATPSPFSFPKVPEPKSQPAPSAPSSAFSFPSSIPTPKTNAATVPSSQPSKATQPQNTLSFIPPAANGTKTLVPPSSNSAGSEFGPKISNGISAVQSPFPSFTQPLSQPPTGLGSASSAPSLLARLGPSVASTTDNQTVPTASGQSNGEGKSTWGPQGSASKTIVSAFGPGSSQQSGASKPVSVFSFKGAASNGSAASKTPDGAQSSTSAFGGFGGFGNVAQGTSAFNNESNTRPFGNDADAPAYTSVHKKWTNPELVQKPSQISAFPSSSEAQGSFKGAEAQKPLIAGHSAGTGSGFGGFGVNFSGPPKSAFSSSGETASGPGVNTAPIPSFKFDSSSTASASSSPFGGNPAASNTTNGASPFSNVSFKFGQAAGDTQSNVAQGAEQSVNQPGGLPSTPTSWTPPVVPRFTPGVAPPRPPGVPPPPARSRSRSTRPPTRR